MPTTMPASYENSPTPEQFAALPQDERNADFLYLIRDVNDYAATYESFTNDSNDVLPSSISISNTPQEILTISTYGVAVAYSLEGNDGENALIGAYYGGTANNNYAGNKTELEKIAQPVPISARVAGARNLFPMDIAISASPLNKDASGVPYRDILYTSGVSGQKETVREYFVSETVDGQVYSWWIDGGTI
ncbi:MAG TPA: hypothetical protein VHZ98_10400 [Galbitalea sp.]|jgi:hypothetical protein|nr:hypothetical protein [Galbitalea sp.]